MKTVTISMKIFDLFHFVYFNSYAFKESLPIPVDVHVRRLTYFSGLIDDEENASNKKIISIWSDICTKVSSNLKKNITIFRIDSLLWQLGRRYTDNKDNWYQEVISYLTQKIQLSYPKAKELINEMFWRLPK